jgi:GNAT superfamily N-acetyltransferase
METPAADCRVTALVSADYPRWLELARGYKAFYKTLVSDEEYERAWRRLLANDRVWGLGARLEGRLVGITHYLFHTGTWNNDVCYLQDLFVDREVRGRGVARALIEAVADAARERGAEKLYWLTQDHNATARALYDKIGKYNNFIRYDYPLHLAK